MTEKNDQMDAETNNEENLTDELDFYDFLEAVSDKVDAITQRSISFSFE